MFVFFAFASLTLVGWQVGTDSGLQFYYLVSASLAVLVLGIEHVALASVVVTIGVGLTIASQFLVPGDTHVQPRWAVNTGFVITTISASVMIFATVFYAMREVSRAEGAMEVEYKRSEALLANILPGSVAERLKDPAHGTIADRYDDASILFADIAGFTERAGQIAAADLVRFLDRLYTTFDRLVDKHGLEKIKTTGDSYMVVSGVPEPRPDHVEALAGLPSTCRARWPTSATPTERGCRCGSVWPQARWWPAWSAPGGSSTTCGATRSTSPPAWKPPTRRDGSRFPKTSTERLKDRFVLEERGEVDVKGKGIMRTWYLVGQQEPKRVAPRITRPEKEWDGSEARSD